MAGATAGQAKHAGLLNFAIYNDEYGQREGKEEEKIMLYIPEEEDIDFKIKNIGLCEALMQFTKTFNPSTQCEVLHTQKTRQVFLNPEGRFFMILTLSIPYIERVSKDGKKLEYFEENVQDLVLKSVLKQAYTMFRLFNGSFSAILQKSGVDVLKEKLQYFYTRYLQTLNFAQFDILDIYHGVSFLPVDKGNFFRVQSFTNIVETTFSCIKHTCFLYNDQLMWTTLEPEDMRILYKYLTSSLFPATLDIDTNEYRQSQQQQQGSSPNSQTLNPGRFLTASIESIDTLPNTPKRAPRLFLQSDDEVKEYYLIVYKSVNAVICLMVASQPQLTMEFYLKLHSFMGVQLASLSNRIAEQLAKNHLSHSDQHYRFLYFNEMNLAIKSSIHGKKSNVVTSVTSDMMKLLVDIHSDFQNISEDGEMIMKNLADCWVVGRRFDKREFFVILNQKNASLVDISEEIKRLVSTSFNSVFFLD
eukprot:gene7703-8540_t